MNYFIFDKTQSNVENDSSINSINNGHADAENRAALLFKDLMKVGQVQVLGLYLIQS